MDIEVEAVERVEAELDAFINKRSREREEANAEAELWRQSERRDRERRRRENAQRWRDYYASMARVHHGIATEHAERAEAVMHENDDERRKS